MWEGSPQKRLCLYNKWTHTEHPFLQYSSLTRFFWCSVPTSIYSIVYFLKESIKQICISVFYIFKDPETKISSQFSSVQSLSHVRLFATPWIAARQASLSITNFWSSLKLTWVSDAIQPSHPLSSPSPPAPIRPSIRVFSNESTLRMRWPKYWSFSFSIIPSKEIPGLISFRMD